MLRRDAPAGGGGRRGDRGRLPWMFGRLPPWKVQGGQGAAAGEAPRYVGYHVAHCRFVPIRLSNFNAAVRVCLQESVLLV